MATECDGGRSTGVAGGVETSAAMTARLYSYVTGGLTCSMIYIGDRLRLYDTLLEHAPCTAMELAQHANVPGLQWVEEWCLQQASMDLICVDEATGRFWLNAVQAQVLCLNHRRGSSHGEGEPGAEGVPQFGSRLVNSAGLFEMMRAFMTKPNELLDMFQDPGRRDGAAGGVAAAAAAGVARREGSGHSGGAADSGMGEAQASYESRIIPPPAANRIAPRPARPEGGATSPHNSGDLPPKPRAAAPAEPPARRHEPHSAVPAAPRHDIPVSARALGRADPPVSMAPNDDGQPMHTLRRRAVDEIQYDVTRFMGMWERYANASRALSVPGHVQQLRDGIVVADVNAGSGDNLLAMAQAYPNSTFHGFGQRPDQLESSRNAARRLGLHNVRFFDGTVPAEAFPSVPTYDFVQSFGVPQAGQGGRPIPSLPPHMVQPPSTAALLQAAGANVQDFAPLHAGMKPNAFLLASDPREDASVRHDDRAGVPPYGMDVPSAHIAAGGAYYPRIDAGPTRSGPYGRAGPYAPKQYPATTLAMDAPLAHLYASEGPPPIRRRVGTLEETMSVPVARGPPNSGDLPTQVLADTGTAAPKGADASHMMGRLQEAGFRNIPPTLAWNDPAGAYYLARR